MKMNYYKAMAIAMAMGLAATPSVSFAAGMEHEAVDETVEQSVEEGLEDELDVDWLNAGAEGTDDNWEAETEDADSGWEAETEDADSGWEADTEDIEDDWEDEDGESVEDDWEDEDGEAVEDDWEDEDGEDVEDDWEDDDWEDTEDDWEDDDWEDEEAVEDDWEDEDGEGVEDDWEDGDWEEEEIDEEWDMVPEEDWACGSDNEQEKWSYDDADNNPGTSEAVPLDPAAPSCAVDEADTPVCQMEAVPDDKTPYVADNVPAAGGIQNAQSSNPASKTIQKGSRNLIRHNASVQAEYAASKDNALAGVYQAEGKMKLYSGAGEKKAILAAADKDANIYCYGYYTEKDGEDWLYVEYSQNGTVYTGFCKSSMLKR